MISLFFCFLMHPPLYLLSLLLDLVRCALFDPGAILSSV
jgi:hypothetical protein